MQNYVFKYSIYKVTIFLTPEWWMSKWAKHAYGNERERVCLNVFELIPLNMLQWDENYAKVKPSWLVDKLGYSWDLIKNEKWKLAKYEWNWNDAK